MRDMEPWIERGISDEVYHAHSFIGSTTAKIGTDNPELLGWALEGRHKTEDKPFFVAGRLLHTAVLEPKRFQQLTVSEGPINPKTGKAYGRGTEKFKKWEEENPDLTYVEEWIRESMFSMPDEVRKILKAGEGEVSFFYGDGDCGVKCRTDWINEKKKHFYDLKSIAITGGSLEHAIERVIRDRGYWFSLAWYKWVLKKVTGDDYAGTLIFAEKGPPYRWRIVDLDVDYQQHGALEVERVMEMLEAWWDGKPVCEDVSDIYYYAECPHYLLNEQEDDEEDI